MFLKKNKIYCKIKNQNLKPKNQNPKTKNWNLKTRKAIITLDFGFCLERDSYFKN